MKTYISRPTGQLSGPEPNIQITLIDTIKDGAKRLDNMTPDEVLVPNRK